jgi:ABC-2 type transport system permease protein
VAGEELSEMRAMLDSDEFPSVLAIVALSEKIATRLGDMRRFVFPPVVQLGSVKEAETEQSGPSANVFGIVLAMVSVMSVLFAATRTVLDLFEEERTGMIRRMLVAPLSPGRILTSKLLFAVCFGIVVEALLLLAGLMLGWFDLSLRLFGALVVAAALSFAAAGLLSLVSASVRTEKQAGLVSFILVMGMSSIGGSMAPVDSFPAGLQTVAKCTLNYWAIEGMVDQLVRNESLMASWRSLVVLCAVGVVTMSTGWLLTRRRLVAVMA